MLAVRGSVWAGESDDMLEDHVVLIDDVGAVAAIEPYSTDVVSQAERVVGSPRAWIGPGVFDRHVHLAFTDPQQLLAGGVVAVRDLGAPHARPAQVRPVPAGLSVHPVGKVLDAAVVQRPAEPIEQVPASGFMAALDSVEQAVAFTAAEHERGAQAIKVGLDDAAGCKSLSPPVLAAAVGAARERRLPVIAHAHSVAMVARALEAGIDELANTPGEPLPASMVRELKAANVTVCSTLQMLFATGRGSAAAQNSAAFVAADITLTYGTDLGNVAGRAGVDPRELDRLATAGLGRLGALRAASVGPLRVGGPARLVLLPDNPLAEPAAWWAPTLVVSERYVAGTAVPPAAGGALGGGVLGGDVMGA